MRRKPSGYAARTLSVEAGEGPADGQGIHMGYDFAGSEGSKLLGTFMVNPLHNIAIC
jgi:hypothetical protein